MKAKKRPQAERSLDTIEHPFVHPCEHPGCSAHGSFGFGVALRFGRRGHWFCHEHRADGERLAAEPQGGPGPAWREQKQGKLL